MPFSPMQRRFLTIAAIFAVVYGIAYHQTRSVLDPKDYYTNAGTSGPFQVVNGQLDRTKPISEVKAGQTFGWISSLCLEEGVDALGVTKLVRASDDHIVNLVEVPITNADKRCGERVVYSTMPIDAEPGYYEIQRSLLLSKGNSSPLSATLQSLGIEVQK